MYSQQLTTKSILLRYLDRLLNPNFDAKFLWLLLISGVGFVSHQRLLYLIANFEFISPEFTARISLSQGTGWCIIILGIIQITVACFFFYRIRISAKNETVVFKSLKQAAPEIRRYLDDNRRIFINFGPNSSTASGGEVRMDMGIWENSKQKIICPNNIKIKVLLNNVEHLNKQEKSIVGKMLNHIEAFNAHCENSNFNYSNHQFPLDFSNLIYKYCAELGNNKNRIGEYSAWLKAAIAKEAIAVESIIFFGSALYGEESVDVDCLVKSEANSLDEVQSDAAKWKSVAGCFERNFNLKLHLTVFSKIEEQAYNNFLSKLPAYQEGEV